MKPLGAVACGHAETCKAAEWVLTEGGNAVDAMIAAFPTGVINVDDYFGGKLASFDAAKVRKMPGVRAVFAVEDNAVAVVADTWWQANTALDALPVIWDKGENAEVSSASIEQMLDEGLRAKQAFVGNTAGDAKTALKGSGKLVEAT